MHGLDATLFTVGLEQPGSVQLASQETAGWPGVDFRQSLVGQCPSWLDDLLLEAASDHLDV